MGHGEIDVRKPRDGAISLLHLDSDLLSRLLLRLQGFGLWRIGVVSRDALGA
jgi:hypothetical protein